MLIWHPWFFVALTFRDSCWTKMNYQVNSCFPCSVTLFIILLYDYMIIIYLLTFCLCWIHFFYRICIGKCENYSNWYDSFQYKEHDFHSSLVKYNYCENNNVNMEQSKTLWQNWLIHIRTLVRLTHNRDLRGMHSWQTAAWRSAIISPDSSCPRNNLIRMKVPVILSSLSEWGTFVQYLNETSNQSCK